jgi:hypothetical protein
MPPLLSRWLFGRQGPRWRAAWGCAGEAVEAACDERGRGSLEEVFAAAPAVRTGDRSARPVRQMMMEPAKSSVTHGCDGGGSVRRDGRSP